jgi:hypothetical protein
MRRSTLYLLGLVAILLAAAHLLWPHREHTYSRPQKVELCIPGVEKCQGSPPAARAITLESLEKPGKNFRTPDWVPAFEGESAHPPVLRINHIPQRKEENDIDVIQEFANSEYVDDGLSELYRAEVDPSKWTIDWTRVREFLEKLKREQMLMVPPWYRIQFRERLEP